MLGILEDQAAPQEATGSTKQSRVQLEIEIEIAWLE